MIYRARVSCKASGGVMLHVAKQAPCEGPGGAAIWRRNISRRVPTAALKAALKGHLICQAAFWLILATGLLAFAVWMML